jgi:hypothetical protein
MLMGESREDSSADAEVGSTQVGAFLRAVKAKGQFSEVVRVDERYPFWNKRILMSVYCF